MAKCIERWHLDRLVPYARNPRTHSDAQAAQIAASIVEFGFINPILVDSKAGIIAGHGRLLAARKLQLPEVPVIVLDHLSENQKRAYVIADNRLAENAGWDEELLRLELAALDEENFHLDLTLPSWLRPAQSSPISKICTSNAGTFMTIRFMKLLKTQADPEACHLRLVRAPRDPVKETVVQETGKAYREDLEVCSSRLKLAAILMEGRSRRVQDCRARALAMGADHPSPDLDRAVAVSALGVCSFWFLLHWRLLPRSLNNLSRLARAITQHDEVDPRLLVATCTTWVLPIAFHAPAVLPTSACQKILTPFRLGFAVLAVFFERCVHWP